MVLTNQVSKHQNHEEDFFQIMCASQKDRTLPNEIMDQNLHCINSAPLQFPNLGHNMLPNSVEADMYYYIIPSNLPAHYSTHYSPAYKP